jgi:hypothetical protein
VRPTWLHFGSYGGVIADGFTDDRKSVTFFSFPRLAWQRHFAEPLLSTTALSTTTLYVLYFLVYSLQ